MTGFAARDERERRVDDRADHWAYLFLSFGLLALVAWRAFTADVPSWDLLGLVVAAGLVAAGYRIRARATSSRSVAVLAIAMLVAAPVAAIAALLLGR